MAERITLDSNVLIYALDDRVPEKQKSAIGLITAVLAQPRLLVTITLGEFFAVATRKNFLPGTLAKMHLQRLTTLFPVVAYGADHVLRAADMAATGRFSFWDAVMLAAAENAGCTVCFSEDMKDGTRLGNIVVRNPFGRKGLSPVARNILGVK